LEPDLAAAALSLAAAAAAATAWRAGRRERAALAAHPPTGEFVTLAGTRMHVAAQGEGPDVVLVHGMSGSLRDFTFRLMPELARTHRVIAVDRPGLGHSEGFDGDEALAEQARLVRQAAAVMGAARPVVVGHSYGAAVALRWAVDAPSTIGGLVALAPVSHPWRSAMPALYRLTSAPVIRRLAVPLIAAWAPMARVRAAFREVFLPQDMPEGYARHFGPGLAIRRPVLYRNAMHRRALLPEIEALAPRYGEIAVPVEILHGDADTTTGLRIHAEPLARAIPGARLTVLPGVGHMPHHAALPETLAAIRRIATRAAVAPERPRRDPAPGRVERLRRRP
jgi:pimeloyl-ACP methyl ester carboxylesterase